MNSSCWSECIVVVIARKTFSKAVMVSCTMVKWKMLGKCELKVAEKDFLSRFGPDKVLSVLFGTLWLSFMCKWRNSWKGSLLMESQCFSCTVDQCMFIVDAGSTNEVISLNFKRSVFLFLTFTSTFSLFHHVFNIFFPGQFCIPPSTPFRSTSSDRPSFS